MGLGGVIGDEFDTVRDRFNLSNLLGSLLTVVTQYWHNTTSVFKCDVLG